MQLVVKPTIDDLRIELLKIFKLIEELTDFINEKNFYIQSAETPEERILRIQEAKLSGLSTQLRLEATKAKQLLELYFEEETKLNLPIDFGYRYFYKKLKEHFKI